MTDLNPQNGDLGRWRITQSGGAQGMGNHLQAMAPDEQELSVVVSDGINTWDINLSVLRNQLEIEVSAHDYYGSDPHTGWSIPLPVGEIKGDLHTLYGPTVHTHKALPLEVS